MSDDKKPFQATPAATLEQHVMDARIEKSEAEWWASREIERLRARVEVLETIRAAAQALIDFEDADTYDPAGKGWEHFEENLRAALEAKL
jgi:hypothetical protein